MTGRLLPGMLACLLVAGCTGPVQPAGPSTGAGPTGPTLPPRPRELRLDGIDPCGTLTAEQLRQLNVDRPGPSISFDSPTCQWDHAFSDPFEGYLVRLRTGQGIRPEGSAYPGARVVMIGGFPAVETFVQPFDAELSCLVVIDTAAGQSIDVEYFLSKGTQPMTHALACRKATAAAEFVMQTLLTQGR